MAVVMGVLIVSFGIWGIADIFRGFGQSTLATVGHTEISTEQFRQLYTDRLQQIGRQVGRPMTMDQARAFGLDRQVLQQTIAEAALDEEARRLGLAQSEEETKRMIFSDPNFKGANGSFDPARFVGEGRDQGRRRADQQIGLGGHLCRAFEHGVEFGSRALEAVHFPIAGDQRSDGVGHVNFQQNEVCACASRAVAAVPES